MGLELLLDLDCDCVGKNALACSELYVNELRSDELVFEGFVGDQLGLDVVVCCVLEVLLRSAGDEG